MGQVLLDVFVAHDERVDSDADICEANQVKFEYFLNPLVDFFGLINFLTGSNQMQKLSILQLRNYLVDHFHQNINGLLILSHLFWLDFDIEGVIIVQTDIFLIVQAKCLVVTVYNHHAKDLD